MRKVIIEGNYVDNVDQGAYGIVIGGIPSASEVSVLKNVTKNIRGSGLIVNFEQSEPLGALFKSNPDLASQFLGLVYTSSNGARADKALVEQTANSLPSLKSWLVENSISLTDLSVNVISNWDKICQVALAALP
jgi:hypothetical protein